MENEIATLVKSVLYDMWDGEVRCRSGRTQKATCAFQCFEKTAVHVSSLMERKKATRVCNFEAFARRWVMSIEVRLFLVLLLASFHSSLSTFLS